VRRCGGLTAAGPRPGGVRRAAEGAFPRPRPLVPGGSGIPAPPGSARPFIRRERRAGRALRATPPARYPPGLRSPEPTFRI